MIVDRIRNSVEHSVSARSRQGNSVVDNVPADLVELARGNDVVWVGRVGQRIADRLAGK